MSISDLPPIDNMKMNAVYFVDFIFIIQVSTARGTSDASLLADIQISSCPFRLLTRRIY